MRRVTHACADIMSQTQRLTTNEILLFSTITKHNFPPVTIIEDENQSIFSTRYYKTNSYTVVRKKIIYFILNVNDQKSLWSSGFYPDNGHRGNASPQPVHTLRRVAGSFTRRSSLRRGIHSRLHLQINITIIRRRRRRVSTAAQPDLQQPPPTINSNSSRLPSRRSDSNARPFLIAVIATIRRFTSVALRTPFPRAPADHHHRAVREQHRHTRHPCFSPDPVSPVSNGPSAPYSSPPTNSQTARVWVPVHSDTIGKLTQEVSELLSSLAPGKRRLCGHTPAIVSVYTVLMARTIRRQPSCGVCVCHFVIVVINYYFLMTTFSAKKIRVFFFSTTFLNLIQAENTFRYTVYPIKFLVCVVKVSSIACCSVFRKLVLSIKVMYLSTKSVFPTSICSLRWKEWCI
ncbi:hypothetical protein AGLY_001994 [Aphis glycines]|uniref:Uncharacterized protein n=1 Tax=Aphis glycines TaxID=307491 RepID=A0A6G0U3W0_APHGL|nr:hypothetical protein AGLY_001994 [Aphis glycines]